MAIILVILVPKIMSMIESAKKGSIESTAKLVASKVELAYKASLAGIEEFPLSGNDADCMKYISDYTREYASCKYTVDYVSGKAKVTLTGKDDGKFSGYVCTDATKTSAECIKGKTGDTVITYCDSGESIHSITITDEDAAIDYLKEEFANTYFSQSYYSLETSMKTQIDDVVINSIERNGIDGIIKYFLDYGYPLTNLSDFSIINYDCNLDNSLSINYVTKMGIDKSNLNKIEFLNTSDFTITGLTPIDISQKGDNSVKGYYNCISSICTLYIVSDNVIKLPINSYSLFSGFEHLSEITFNNYVDTSNVTNMQEMFYDSLVLTTLDLSNFDTSNVTNMSEMFGWCSSLISVDLNSFDTSNVTNMQWMFQQCESLIELDLNKFDTSKVTTMMGMFDFCLSLQSVDLSNFNTSNVTDMQEMFRCCSNLITTLTISNNVEKYKDMLYDAATETGTSIILKGTSGFESLIDNMILTKSNSSNVTKQID